MSYQVEVLEPFQDAHLGLVGKSAELVDIPPELEHMRVLGDLLDPILCCVVVLLIESLL